MTDLTRKELLKEIFSNNGITMVIFAANSKATHEVISKAIDECMPIAVNLGSWKGELETSYRVLARTFPDSFFDTEFTSDQNSFLLLQTPTYDSDDNAAAKAFLLDNKTLELTPLGFYHPTDKETALAAEGFTYDTSVNIGFIITEGRV